MLFPAIDLPEVPLWGFTYRLLLDWLGAFPFASGRPGFVVAQRILDVVLSQGMSLRSSWPTPKVNGAIPVNAVLESLSVPGEYVAYANRVEVQRAFVRVHGLEFEEYLIEAVGD